MSEFEALGRDVGAAADSTADNPVALAVKQLWPWAQFDQGENPNHLWKVEFWKNENGFAVAATLVDKNVWAPEPSPAPPATPEELRSLPPAEPALDVPAPADVPAEPAEPVAGLDPDPVPDAEDAPAVDAPAA